MTGPKGRLLVMGDREVPGCLLDSLAATMPSPATGAIDVPDPNQRAPSQPLTEPFGVRAARGSIHRVLDCKEDAGFRHAEIRKRIGR